MFLNRLERTPPEITTYSLSRAFSQKWAMTIFVVIVTNDSLTHVGALMS